MGQAAIMALVAITGLEAITGRVVITGQEATTGRAAIMAMEVIMGTGGTTGMEIHITHVSLSAQDGVDGDQAGGVLQPTRIIHTTRTIQRPLLLSDNSPRRMFSRIRSNPIIGTTVKIPRAITPILTPARADG